MGLILFLYGILIVYGLVLGFLWYFVICRKKAPHFAAASHKFSIVIPFRNEADNLPKLAQSLAELNYPTSQFELIFINDASEDNSVQILSEFKKTHPEISLQILHSKGTSNAPKKEALTKGILAAKHSWIVTTDADCIVPKNWLQSFNTTITLQQPICIAAPVAIKADLELLTTFQQIENAAMQMCTHAFFEINTPLLCNGANFAFLKDAFIQVNGYSGNENISSGDDIFLLEKFTGLEPHRCTNCYQPDAIVITNAEHTWAGFFLQRVRWASKTTKQKSLGIKALGILQVLTNVSLLFLCVLSFLKPNYWLTTTYYFSLKTAVDIVFVFPFLKFSKTKIPFYYFFLVALLYPFTTLVITLKSMYGGYIWKGRKVSRI